MTEELDLKSVKARDLQADSKALGRLVVQALAPLDPEGWGSLDLQDPLTLANRVKVQEHSGGSGNQTFRVSVVDSKKGTPSEVALHCRDPWYKQSEARTSAAAALLGDHGLSPKRLAQGLFKLLLPILAMLVVAARSLTFASFSSEQIFPLKMKHLRSRLAH